jgi:hypothetical protein
LFPKSPAGIENINPTFVICACATIPPSIHPAHCRQFEMETSLRPMTLGEILDRTAQLYRTNFLLFAGIAAVYAGVLLLVGLAQTGVQEWMRVEHMYRQLLWMTGLWVLLTWIVIFIFGGIAVAANNRAVAWLHLGEPATIRGAYRSILPRLGRYLWLGFLMLVYAWLPVILIYAAFIGAAIYMRVKGLLPRAGAAPPVNTAHGPALIAFGVIVIVLFLLLAPAFIYGIVMWLRYALAVPACVVENLKARAAIRRSVELSKWSRGRIFVLALLVAVIEIGLAAVTQSFFVIEALKHHQQLPIGLRILQQFVSFCTNTFVTPILATGLTLFYYDQRVRKEGYDIEWMMEAAGLTAPAAVALPPPEQAPAEQAPAESGPAEFAPPEPRREAGNVHD